MRYFKNDSENIENFNVQLTVFNASKNSVDTQYSNWHNFLKKVDIEIIFSPLNYDFYLL